MKKIKKISVIANFILLTLFCSLSVFAAGEVDTNFLANLSITSSGRVTRVIIQPDGKILVAGNFRVINGVARGGIARLNPDGTIDLSFNPPDFSVQGVPTGTVESIALQSNGKILVSGAFRGVGSDGRTSFVRLNSDGSLDTTFPHLFPVNGAYSVSGIIVYPDDSFLISGTFSLVSPNGNRNHLARLSANGSLDTSHNYNGSPVSSMLLQPDGKLVVGQTDAVRRLNADASPDSSFTQIFINANTSSVLDMEYLPDGKILIGGSFTMVNGFLLSGLVRANPDGSVDTSFPNLLLNGSVRAITPDTGGKFYIGGSFTRVNETSVPGRIARLNADGTRDTSFQAVASTATINDIARQSDGKIILGREGLTNQNPLLRLNTDGTLDTFFSVPISGSGGSGLNVIVQPDNKIIAGGQFTSANGVTRTHVARFNPDGTLDTGFTPPNIGQSGQVFEMDLQPDGKLLIVGSIGNAKRLNTNGTLDVEFSNTQSSWEIKYLPGGKVLVAGANLRRFNADGSFDTTLATLGGDFGSNPTIYEIAVQPDGKLIVVGTFTMINGASRSRIARLNADGTLDSSFNPPGGANAHINAVALQFDGKILIGGDFTGVNFDVNKKYLARLNPDGSLDAAFSPVLNAPLLGLKIQSDGRILIGGAMNVVNGAVRSGIARLNADGTLDASFNVGTGTNSTVWSIDQQSDGKIVYVGQFSRTNGFSTLGIGRLLNATVQTRKLFDYDGDGKADISVFRPSENRWYVLRSSDGQVTQQVFAINGDVPVPSDYDGDGKTDFAVFRPSSGDWWYLSSVNNAQIFADWGQSGDIPRPGDFDGDGKSDFIVYRPSNNFWHRITNNVNSTVSNQQFGLSGDKPVSGDFDGDGKVDNAIYRPSTGDWWYQSSINNAQLAVRWGISTDIPTPADYDGDGRTDIAVYRPETGVWYIINSSNGLFTIMNFGLAEDKPVPADYDGDGKADIAVFRPSTGVWYLQRSTAGFTALQFGISSDIPTPSSFVP